MIKNSIKRFLPLMMAVMLVCSGCGNKTSQESADVSDSASGSETVSQTEQTSESGLKTAVVTPTATVKPTATAAPTPTKKPTAEPTVTTTPEPTVTMTPEATPEPSAETTPEPTPEPEAVVTPEESTSLEPQIIGFDSSWEFAGNSVINSGTAVLYKAQSNRKNITIGLNAGHGTSGGESVRTYCHPDGSAKVTGGSTSAGAVTATAISSGMTFLDGTAERDVTLQEAMILKEYLLANGYDVLMIRESDDVQLDNIARTVMCNNIADCHIAIHWDGDGLNYDKGCFYMAVADGVKDIYPVSNIWQEDNWLGDCLIIGLAGIGCDIFDGGSMQMDLTQTSYSTIPSVDIELGNAASDHSEETLKKLAYGLLVGINSYFGY